MTFNQSEYKNFIATLMLKKLKTRVSNQAKHDWKKFKKIEESKNLVSLWEEELDLWEITLTAYKRGNEKQQSLKTPNSDFFMTRV